MNYSLSSMEKISNNFEKFLLILGNHDLPYKEKREINSVEFGRNIKNLILIKDILVEGNCAFVPWLVGEEYQQLPKIKAKYIFGHFELPHFLMNAMVEMPDTGKINIDDFSAADYVFSGHFHKRQFKKNQKGTEIIYIGNAFPHNFSDAWDDDRGIMLLEWGKKPVFKTWPDQPTYKTLKFSQLLQNFEKYLKPKSSIKLTLDTNLTFEEQNFIKECFLSHFDLRDFVIMQARDEDEDEEISIDLDFQSIDQIVIEGLSMIESKTVDPNILIELYRSL
jgi:DNA repair exonuclease SbcCD nuclease subunit